MPLITRQENGGPLTIEQMDENFLYLESISGGSGSGTSGINGSSGTSGVKGPTGPNGATGPSGATPSLHENTYTELQTLISNSELIAGQTYLLSDYMTTYIQPETGATKSSGIVEQLYLTALSTNSFHSVAKSGLYPQDIIYYSFTGDLNNYYGTEGFTKGKIWRRIDTERNNDIGTDWRHVKYDRSGTDKLLFEAYSNVYGNTVRTYNLMNTIVGNGFVENYIERGFDNNTIGNSFGNNTIGIGFSNNTISGQFYANKIRAFQNNIISNNFTLNNIDGFYNNITDEEFSNNTIIILIGNDLSGMLFQSNITTVANLNTLLNVGFGQRFYVTDANNPTYLSPVVGGGSTLTPVLYANYGINGVNWVCN